MTAPPTLALAVAAVALGSVAFTATATEPADTGPTAQVVQPRAQPAALPAARSPGPLPRPGHGWTWPLSPAPTVVRVFALGPHPWSPGHRGVDLRPRGDDRVLAAGPGVIRFTGMVAGRPVVSVQHGDALRTTYEPVQGTVPVGQPVVAGQAVGRLVDGRHCTVGRCLHWGALIGDRYVDPLSLLLPREPPVLLPPDDR